MRSKMFRFVFLFVAVIFCHDLGVLPVSAAGNSSRETMGAASAALVTAPSTPTKADPVRSVLRMEDIMQGDAFVGHQPGQPYWSADGRSIYFMWNPDGAPSDSLHRYDLLAGTIEKVDAVVGGALPPRQHVYSRDRSLMLYVRNGDVFLHDVASGRVQQVTATLQGVSSPSFTGDERGVVWVSGNNLYRWDRQSGQLLQLTDFRSGQSRPDAAPSAQDQWLIDQQLELFDVISSRQEERALREEQQQRLQERQKAVRAQSGEDAKTGSGRYGVIPEGYHDDAVVWPVSRPKPIYTGQARVMNQQICPNERFVTYTLMTNPSGVKQTRVPVYVTESGYTEEMTAYAKVGSDQSTFRMYVYDLERDTVYPVNTSAIPGIRDVPAYMREYGYKEETLKADREVSISGPFWSDDGRYAVVNIRAQDNKDRWIMLLDPQSGELSLLDRQHDEAWVAGPGINVWRGGSMGWMPGNRRLWFQSEETGYSHLYTVDVVTGEKRALTSGSFEVYTPSLSHDKKHWYFSSNEVHPGERHFYSMPLEGGGRTRLTTMAGRHDAVVSPDGRHLAIRYSSATQPWELYLMENRRGAEPRRLTYSTTDGFLAYDWRTPELVAFSAEDGGQVWARLYMPAAEVHNGAAVIFVHGAGYLQNAHKWWSRYLREYMFHNMLADRGYTVLDIDYRGSAGYGRDWRTGIYRHMGGKDLSDHVDGARFLMEQHGVEQGRIGIYGGSYGGFITLMAMFKHPETFAAGAALRSVTDWAHYHQGYTSNILNTPVSDSLAYRRSSPIYFAEGLEGALLMCHGMIDDNVHFQDIVRLTQRLIELGKDNWELAVYPVEGHSFTETSSWVDEYKRILKLFEENLR
jgi:dipeptidyl aminopeptidase/acylaminoacyl peptidase